MENKTQDYQSEILAIIRGNTSPGVMRNKLEDYHENDLADVFSELTAAERRKVCRILNLDMLSDIFEYIDEKQAAEYLDAQGSGYSFRNGDRCRCRCSPYDTEGEKSTSD